MTPQLLVIGRLGHVQGLGNILDESTMVVTDFIRKSMEVCVLTKIM